MWFQIFIIILRQRREKQIQKQVLMPTVTEFATFSWPFSSANELWSLLPNTASKPVWSFCICKLRPKIPYWYIKRVVNLYSMLNDLTLTFIKRGKNEKNLIPLQTRSRTAAVSCFRVMILRWKKSCFMRCRYVTPLRLWESWTISVRIPWYWLSTSITKYFISRDWPKPEITQEVCGIQGYSLRGRP